MAARWKLRLNEKCPRCGKYEDTAHVWRCQQTHAKTVWKTSMKDLSNWFTEQQTNPQIAEAILTGLHAWHQNVPVQFPTFTFPELNKTLQQQNEIGWQSFLEGWVSTGWQLIQQRHYQWLESKRSGRRWVIALIKKLWQVAWDQWEHRNATLHKQTSIPSIEASEHLNTTISAEYHSGSITLLPQDRYLFGTPLDKLLKQSFDQRTLWLQRIRTARNACHVTHQSSSRHERNLLRAWLSST